MKIRFGAILLSYFNSWWLPGACFVALLALFMIAPLPKSIPPDIIPSTTLAGLCLGFVGILTAAVWNLFKMRWIKALTNLALLPVCPVATLICFVLADTVAIPHNLIVSEPDADLEALPGDREDLFQANVLAALRAPASGDESITADLTSLRRLQKQHPDLLRRYLAASAAWRVFAKDGNVFATRRWMIGSHWQYTLHGGYTRRDFDTWSEAAIPDFQSRTTIGLTGVPWFPLYDAATRLEAGTTARAILSESGQMYDSRCVITAGNIVVEVVEESQGRARRLTKAALRYLDEELEPLVRAPSWKTIRKILPTGSIRHGTLSLELRNSFQPGIYTSEVWVNPGESGMLYLKAFEVTRGTPLSVRDLKQDSNEWVGWSDDPRELFLSNTRFTIGDDNWGKPYAARFEVWFMPDSGGAERKLLDRIFKIEGWVN